MKALINTPTKILAKVKTFTLSSRSPSAVSWTSETSLLKSLNGTHLCPISSGLSCRKACHSLGSSNSEVHSETEAAKTKESQTDGSKVASLRLELKKECEYGEHFLVVGDDQVLGSWNPLNAAPLHWSDGHMWTVDLELPVGRTIHYKFICKLSTGDIVWQPGSDRTIRLTERHNVVIITEEWENAEAHKIINQEKPIVDTPETKSSDPFGGSSYSHKKLMARTENSFNTSESAKKAYIADDTPVNHRIRENSGARDHTYAKKDPCICTAKTKDELPVQKSNQKTEEESLVIYDEGRVLVPGLKFQVITEEALAKELKNTIMESLVKYDGSQVLVPDLNAQLITEETVDKETQIHKEDGPPW